MTTEDGCAHHDPRSGWRRWGSDVVRSNAGNRGLVTPGRALGLRGRLLPTARHRPPDRGLHLCRRGRPDLVRRLRHHARRGLDHPQSARDQSYDYAAPAFEFACRLVYDESGLVLSYPGIAGRVVW